MRFLFHKYATLLLAALGSAASMAAVPAVNPALLYHNYCSVCHGDRGDGQSRGSQALNPPPRNFTSAASKQELVRERIIHSISNGRPGTAMVAWKSQLNEREIAGLADYLLATFIRSGATNADNRGRDIYAKTCAVCHGDAGNGGTWTSGMALKPRDFTTTPPSALSRATMIDVVTKG
ncbi:MAG TPA: c-type cytochrome, partial [Gammaproteobacteria bacterium]